MKSDIIRVLKDALEAEKKATPGDWQRGSSGGLTNEGARPLMAYRVNQDDCSRVGTMECQTPFKRGQGWQTECEQREANVDLVTSAVRLVRDHGAELLKLLEK